MIRNKFIYLGLVICSSIFLFMYRDYLALMTFVIVFLVPLVFVIIMRISKFGVKAELEIKNSVIEKDEMIEALIYLYNYSFAPIQNIKLKLTCINEYDKKIYEEYINMPMVARSKEKINCKIEATHCGKVRVCIENVRIFDYFKLFSCKKKIKKQFKEIIVMPKLKAVNDLDIDENMIAYESGNYSEIKKGDDVSEVFDIREYVESDKIKNIHWKLSLKQDKIMVKDYSLPINDNVLILAELSTIKNNLDIIDSILQMIYSVSFKLIEQQIKHNVGWYDTSTNEIRLFNINSENDLLDMMGYLFDTSFYENAIYLLENIESIQNEYSKCFYITPDAQKILDISDENILNYFMTLNITVLGY